MTEMTAEAASPEQRKLMQRYTALFAPGTQREAARVTVHCIRRLGGTIEAGKPRKLTPAEALQLTEEDFEAA